MAVKPNGGWGWVIALASLVRVILDGVKYSFGIIFLELVDAFQVSKNDNSWTISVQIGIMSLTGPIIAALVNRFGCRSIALAGTLLSFVGFLASAFVESLYLLYVTFGFFGGFGFGMLNLPTVVMLARYFDKRLAFASGIAAMGSGAGTLIFNPLSKFLIDSYTWRGTFLINSGIILNGVACALVMIPPPEDDNDSQAMEVVCEENTKSSDTTTMSSSVNEKESMEYSKGFKRSDNTNIISDEALDNQGEETNSSIGNETTDMQSDYNDIKAELSERSEHLNGKVSSTPDGSKYNIEENIKSLDITIQSSLNERESIEYNEGIKQLLGSDNSNLRSDEGLDNQGEETHSGKGNESTDMHSDYNNIKTQLSERSEHLYGKLTSTKKDNKVNSEENIKSSDTTTISSSVNERESTEYNKGIKQLLGSDNLNLKPEEALDNQREDTNPGKRNETTDMHSDYNNSKTEPSERPEHLNGKLSSTPYNENGEVDLETTKPVLQAIRVNETLSEKEVKEFKNTNIAGDKTDQQKSVDTVDINSHEMIKLKSCQSLAVVKVDLGKDMEQVRKVALSHEVGAAELSDIDKGGDSEHLENSETKSKRLFSLAALKNPGFLIYLIAEILIQISLNTPFTFLPDMMLYKGFQTQDAVWMLFITGVVSTVSRIVIGLIADLPFVNRLKLCNSIVVLNGLVVVFCPFCFNYASFVAFSVAFGFFTGSSCSLRYILIPDLFGVEMIADLCGITMFFSGIAALVGLPISGVLFDATGNYVIPFVVAGAELTMSGLLLFFIPAVQNCSRTQQKSSVIDT